MVVVRTMLEVQGRSLGKVGKQSSLRIYKASHTVFEFLILEKCIKCVTLHCIY